MLSNSIKTKLLKTFNLNKNKQPIINQEESASDLEYTDNDDDANDNNDNNDDDNANDNANDANNEYSISEESESVINLNISNNNYTYYADELNKDIPNKVYNNIHILIYKINTQELHPFIMFLLYKDDNNELNFPREELLFDKATGNKNDSINYLLEKLRKLFEESNVSIEYKGFIDDDSDNTLIIIFKHNTHNEATNKMTTVATPSIKQMFYDSKWWWALASEIINYKTILNFKINNFATKFLIQHNKLVFLYDDNGIIYETPEIGYYGNYYKKIAAVASLGLSRQSPYSSFGPFYYFSDYTHAMRNAFWTLGFKPKEVNANKSETSNKYITVDDKGRYEKGGIVKFALFAGKTKMLMGRENDVKDDSSISIDLAEKNDFVKAMLKLRDSSAKWTKEYNSIRIGSHVIKLPGKPDIHTNPLIALKEYEQQVPLEYYFVDTSQNVNESNINTAVIS